MANVPNYKQYDHAGLSHYEQQQREMFKKMNGRKEHTVSIMERVERYNNYLTYYKKQNLDIASRDYE